MEKVKPLPAKVLNALAKVEIKECEMCGAYISGTEYKENERVCAKHWDY